MKAIGFDMGDTLLCYEGIPLSWVDHYKPAFKSAAKVLETEISCEALKIVDDVFSKYNTRIYPRENEISSDSIFEELFGRLQLDKKFIPKVENLFFDYFQRKCVAFSESLSVLSKLRTSGVMVGVLTDVPYGMNKEFVIEDLKKAKIYSEVDVLITSVDAGFRKPNMTGYKKLAMGLNIDITDLIYVGNEEKDILGVNDAGGKSVLINRSDQELNFGQHRTIRSLNELLIN